VQALKWLETLRDRVVHRSQIGKRKLDRNAARRELDHAARELGERYRALVRTGKAQVPGELMVFVEAVKLLEEKLAAVDEEIARLERERPSAR
jgi:ubiquinone biosynthesis protein UbiJ